MGLLALQPLALAQAPRRLPTSQTPAPVPARRLALVVGNDAYEGAPLRNARNDARAMTRALRELGFDVTALEDTTRSVLAFALLAFGRRLTATDLALVYYAGHGVQVEGENYLVPIDFRGRTEDAVRVDALAVGEVTRALGRARVAVLVLDACRNNPFTGTRDAGRGLAQVEARGTLVLFAAGAGQTADDSAADANSVFTGELVRALGEPGLGLRDIAVRVRQRVLADQRPAVPCVLRRACGRCCAAARRGVRRDRQGIGARVKRGSRAARGTGLLGSDQGQPRGDTVRGVPAAIPGGTIQGCGRGQARRGAARSGCLVVSRRRRSGRQAHAVSPGAVGADPGRDVSDGMCARRRRMHKLGETSASSDVDDPSR